MQPVLPALRRCRVQPQSSAHIDLITALRNVAIFTYVLRQSNTYHVPENTRDVLHELTINNFIVIATMFYQLNFI